MLGPSVRVSRPGGKTTLKSREYSFAKLPPPKPGHCILAWLEAVHNNLTVDKRSLIPHRAAWCRLVPPESGFGGCDWRSLFSALDTFSASSILLILPPPPFFFSCLHSLRTPATMPPPVDYSVYLVTDATPAILGPGRTVVEVVGAALAEPEKKHIGIVQLRDKDADARTMLATLAALHAYTAPAGAPLVVNDRVDVAVAAMARGHCEGVHLGQDDIDVATARKMLGPEAIIGVTASTVDEAVTACRDGADYLGLGTVFATPTKTNTKHVVGTPGIQRMLQAVVEAGFAHVPTVCIGGIHTSNARRVIFQSGYRPAAAAAAAEAAAADGAETGGKELDGVAVVSAIMGAADPGAAAAALAEQVRLGKTQGPTDFYCAPPPSTPRSSTQPSPACVQRILQALHETTPLSHNMTNLVVQNIAANVALAVGASPIMSNSGAEAADLARLPGSALVVNMGTVTPESLANYVKAIAAYNAAGRPVIFDPVG